MKGLEQRLEVLEKMQPASTTKMIVHRIVNPGHLDAEAYRAEIAGATIERRESETEQDFIDRVAFQAIQHSGRDAIPQVILYPYPLSE